MLSRRLLRVKVMQMVYAYYKNGDTTITRTEKELFHSVSKSYELYHLFLLLLVELRNQEEIRLDLRKNKHIPTEDDLNPSTQFVDNKILKHLSTNKQLLKYQTSSKISWNNDQEFIRKIMGVIRQTQLYVDYLNCDNNTIETDRKFISKLTEKVIAPLDELYACFEELSIYWNDEVEFIISMVLKTIKEYDDKEAADFELLPEFKDDDDKDFVKVLFRKSITNEVEYRALIDKHTKNWDIERVAFIDIVLMQIALTEIMEFPNIPVKVTLNEYIELAKHYSTGKSGVFINGVLDKIVENLNAENKISKRGRGLVSEV